ncbi:Glutamyl- or glutaminyl-tRNA synthetase [Pseudomonas syringae pv. actinidiae]|uniref:Glutamyl- or glutaminyl-tRNA synthetase n=1 Tax=Pseudomonas syringae pv. actinidiae TaxID=103796 RepID=A0AAN4TPV8_PSESF|nr:Glutamyl- or glutaminyl-tRNA synthetase [Pseudomonas syringae pv. actinidiae]
MSLGNFLCNRNTHEQARLTCLLSRWQPVYRRHELNTGFDMERENLAFDAKGNDKRLPDQVGRM